MNQALLQSGRMDWGTPRAFFRRLHAVFQFTLDPATTSDNPLGVAGYYTPEENGLACRWAPHTVFLNPPYGRQLPRWIDKAVAEAKLGATVVCLVPARPDTKWWHAALEAGAEVTWVRGRLTFEGAAGPAPFPSAVLVLRPRLPAVLPAR